MYPLRRMNTPLSSGNLAHADMNGYVGYPWIYMDIYGYIRASSGTYPTCCTGLDIDVYLIECVDQDCDMSSTADISETQLSQVLPIFTSNFNYGTNHCLSSITETQHTSETV